MPECALPVSASRRATEALVHLDRLAGNVRAVRALLNPETALLAVIKANGYGHGAVPVARTALAAGASWLGVACVDEGVALRNAGLGAPILVMGYASPAEVCAAVRHGLVLTLGSPAQTEAFACEARRTGATLHVHLKIDSGMGRFGAVPGQIESLAHALLSAPELVVDGCFTHFARGEENPALATDQQLSIFDQCLDVLHSQGVHPQLLHAANSGAVLAARCAHFNLVRCGLLMYGYTPDQVARQQLPLKPVMEIRSALARVQRLPAGAGIGYGHAHRLEQAAPIGLVPVGYADGLQRVLSGKAYLVTNGVRVPIVGRISMDQCMVDLTAAPRAAEGDAVIILGSEGGESISADDIAGWAGTVSYEILCGISPRVPRRYLSGEKSTAAQA